MNKLETFIKRAVGRETIQKSRVSPKNVRSRGNLLLLLFFVLSFLGCKENSTEEGEKPDTNVENVYKLFSNPNDPLFMRYTENNYVVEFYGSKDSTGLPTSFDYAYIHNEDASEKMYAFFENEQLSRFILNDGSVFHFDWLNEDKAKVSIAFSDGLLSRIVVDLKENTAYPDTLKTATQQIKSLSPANIANNKGNVFVSTCDKPNNDAIVWVNTSLGNGEPRKIPCYNIGNGNYNFDFPLYFANNLHFQI
ncbi:MAG: hypothetical protein LBR17_04910 [Bacteroidales bacterium]|jgi:hypothetical protein|nr:hypothetical protein [Bacteroidales bacterium]